MKTLHIAIIIISILVFALSDNSAFGETTMKKILGAKEFEKFAESSLTRQILWSEESPTFVSFFWTQNSMSIIFRVNDVDALWSINQDGTNLKKINVTDIVPEAIHHPYNQLGNFEVNTNFCDKCPSRGLTLKTVNGTYSQNLDTGKTNPVAPAISPDGNFIVFGSNSDPWNTEQDRGIYLLVLSPSVPEFPFPIPILLVSITSLIVFYRIQIRK